MGGNCCRLYDPPLENFGSTTTQALPSQATPAPASAVARSGFNAANREPTSRSQRRYSIVERTSRPVQEEEHVYPPASSSRRAPRDAFVADAAALQFATGTFLFKAWLHRWAIGGALFVLLALAHSQGLLRLIIRKFSKLAVTEVTIATASGIWDGVEELSHEAYHSRFAGHATSLAEHATSLITPAYRWCSEMGKQLASEWSTAASPETTTTRAEGAALSLLMPDTKLSVLRNSKMALYSRASTWSATTALVSSITSIMGSISGFTPRKADESTSTTLLALQYLQQTSAIDIDMLGASEDDYRGFILFNEECIRAAKETVAREERDIYELTAAARELRRRFEAEKNRDDRNHGSGQVNNDDEGREGWLASLGIRKAFRFTGSSLLPSPPLPPESLLSQVAQETRGRLQKAKEQREHLLDSERMKEIKLKLQNARNQICLFSDRLDDAYFPDKTKQRPQREGMMKQRPQRGGDGGFAGLLGGHGEEDKAAALHGGDTAQWARIRSGVATISVSAVSTCELLVEDIKWMDLYTGLLESEREWLTHWNGYVTDYIVDDARLWQREWATEGQLLETLQGHLSSIEDIIHGWKIRCKSM